MLHGHKSHTPDPVVLTVAMCGTHHEVPRCAVSFSSFYCLFTSANINTLVVLNTHCKGNIPKQKYVFFVLWFLKPRNLVAASAPYWKAWKEISITKFKEPAITVPGAKRHEDDGCVVFCRVVLCPVVSCCVVSRRVVSCSVVLCYILSCCVVSCRVVSCRVVLCFITSCRVVSCCVVPQNVTAACSRARHKHHHLFLTWTC